ncbi:sce7726 family protein [Terasakiella sp.]|uniref:sce7726 family protein n=1 Tax=Terasakiella sp. TaxID=2034861 RepID=UPI003AA83386
MQHTNDKEIRKAIHKKLLRKYHNCEETIVIDELGVEHGRNRIDIAVLNGLLHGYEIKSSLDTLNRLGAQIESFAKCFEKLTLIVAPNHLETTLEEVPSWIGVIEASKGSRGAIHFKSVRNPKINPNLNVFYMSHLLWKPEAISLLENKGVSLKELKGSRKNLYTLIAEKYDVRGLTEEIKRCFFSRSNWRVLLQHV